MHSPKYLFIADMLRRRRGLIHAVKRGVCHTAFAHVALNTSGTLRYYLGGLSDNFICTSKMPFIADLLRRRRD